MSDIIITIPDAVITTFWFIFYLISTILGLFIMVMPFANVVETRAVSLYDDIPVYGIVIFSGLSMIVMGLQLLLA